MYHPDLKFAIDVSGTPFGKTIIGCISVKSNDYSSFISNYKKTFKKIWRRKGKDLTYNELKKILKYLDQRKIRSLSMSINANDWTYILAKIPKDKAYRTEKLFGVLYYMVLKTYSIPKKPYSVTVCEENFMDIKTVRSSCRKIAKLRGMEYNISISSGRYDDLVRIADVIASCGRNIKKNQLDQFKFHIHKNKIRIPEQFISKVFR